MQLTRHLSLRPADLLGEFDRFFRSGVGLPRRADSISRDFALYESDESWILRTDLPGFRKDELGLEVQDGVLTLSGTGNEDRFTGSFQRSLRLPKGVKAGGITARLEDGVLELVLPKEQPQEPETLRIDIN